MASRADTEERDGPDGCAQAAAVLRGAVMRFPGQEWLATDCANLLNRQERWEEAVAPIRLGRGGVVGRQA